MAKTPALKKPKFGGKPKTADRPPPKKQLEQYGPVRHRAEELPIPIGNVETGFIQSTPKKATGAMMGRPPPPLIARSTSTRKDSRKQFKPRGKKVF